MPTIEAQIHARLRRIKPNKSKILTENLLKQADKWITNKKVSHLWTSLRKITIGIPKQYRQGWRKDEKQVSSNS